MPANEPPNPSSPRPEDLLLTGGEEYSPPDPQGNSCRAEKPSDLLQGTLDMLILKTIALESMYGYGIAVRIEQMSKGIPAWMA